MVSEHFDLPRASPDPNPSDFKTEFHPRSKRQMLYQSAEEFGQQDVESMDPDPMPWCPFASEGDFTFAKVAVEAGLLSGQVDHLLGLINSVLKGTAKFSKLNVTVPYKGEDIMFPLHVCPLWEWALDMLTNPLLAPHFVWDAQRLFKHDGQEVGVLVLEFTVLCHKHFYTEPWMGERWWDVQASLPADVNNAAPFAFIIYADKTQLSSHGTIKGYPVIARLANLPVHICNGERFGGGCVVGWLPIVPEPAKEQKKTGYT
ncbi:hypothetical protein PAXRUDRAFT_791186, partial [Paxillus rubicundulus Ve08.2h10]